MPSGPTASSGSPAAYSAIERSMRTVSPASRPCLADRSFSGGSRVRSSHRPPPWPRCSRPTCETWAPPSHRFATRSRRPRPAEPAQTQHRTHSLTGVSEMAVVTQDDLLEAIDKMTVLELSEFIKRFEDRYGVTAAAPVAVAAAPAAGGAAAATDGAAAAATEEQTEFSAVLTEVGPNKIPVIKVVRELTQLGLKEAKDLVDAAPKPVKEGIARDEAEKIKSALEEQGAKVEIK